MNALLFKIRGHTFSVYLLTIICLIPIAISSGCDSDLQNRLRNTPPDAAAKTINENQDFYAKHLKIGMSKTEVLSLMPDPQNTNTQNVWLWVFDSTENIPTRNRLDWQWLQSTRGGFFSGIC
ncbi:MAG: hypothetical protein P4N60_14880 [Verrucomicrobiae bacterium]|nr:hypothetical protein [Verrucomicrobiae bacterium]